MWNQFESLSEEKIFKNTFSINSLFKIGNGDEVSVDYLFFSSQQCTLSYIELTSIYFSGGVRSTQYAKGSVNFQQQACGHRNWRMSSYVRRWNIQQMQMLEFRSDDWLFDCVCGRCTCNMRSKQWCHLRYSHQRNTCVQCVCRKMPENDLWIE